MTALRAGATCGIERERLATYPRVGGMDEVGRGALAGPVCVGLVVVDRHVEEPPAGIADSKLLTARRRETLAGPCASWGRFAGVGAASAAEVDRWGIIAALRLAGRRVLAEAQRAGCAPDLVILDGSHDWLSVPAPDLFADPSHPDLDPRLPEPRVETMVKADRAVACVAAASIVAKVRRDRFMEALPDPGYGWASNKGYAAPRHVEGLVKLGQSRWHRRSWRLPGRREERRGE